MTYEKYVELRDKMGISDYQVAKEAGINRSTFSDWKSGRSIPKLPKLKKIADFFGVPLDAFGDETEIDKEFTNKFIVSHSEMLKPFYMNKEAEAIANAYLNAPESIKDAVAKLLDVKRANFDLESFKEA